MDMNDNYSSMNSHSGRSADEIRQAVKETVAKGVAAAAGAVEGFSEEMEQTDFTANTKKALAQAGEVTREAATAVKREIQSTAQALKGGAEGGLKSSPPTGGSSQSSLPSSGSWSSPGQGYGEYDEESDLSSDQESGLEENRLKARDHDLAL